MVPLARKTLVHEWRRFLPATLAVALSGLLLLMQAALVLGIFGSAGIYVTASRADLWIGYPGTQSIEMGRPIGDDVEMRAMMDPDVIRVEPFRWVGADWRGPRERGAVSVFVSGIDPRPDGLMFADALEPDLRQRLYEPDGVIVDRAELDKLGVGIGGYAMVNRHRVHVVGVASGLRALGGVNVVASGQTAARVDDQPDSAGRVAYYVARLRDPARAEAVAARLNATADGRYQVWTRAAFARQAVRYWMFETGAGLGVVFLAAVVFVVGAVITSQTLIGAVAGSLREYATLRALGVSLGGLRRVVLAQSCWVGVTGLLIGGALGLVAIGLARRHDVPVALGATTMAACAAIVLGIALVSGLAAVRTLRHADPADLLR